MQLTLRRLSKWLGFLALGCYVFLALALLGIRYWALPNIDQWRGPLQRQLSTVLGAEVELGPLTADWRGRHLSVSVRDTRLRDGSGRRLLEIPAVDAVLAWQSLFTGTPRFLVLRAQGVELTLRRDSQGRVSILGHDIEGGDQPPGPGASDAPLLNWLSKQGTVQFSNARIRWIDGMRHAPALVLDGVSLSLGMDGAQYVFSLRARPPDALGKEFSLHGRVALADNLTGLLAPEQISGLFHINVDDMQPAAWQPWMDVHSVLEEGEIDWHAWQEVTAGVPGRHVSQVTIDGGVWRLDEGVLRAGSAQFHFAGSWQAMQSLWVQPGMPAGPPAPPQANGEYEGVRVALRTSGLSIDAPALFEAPLAWDDIALSLAVGRSASNGLELTLDRAQLRNPDMDLDLGGRWQQHGGEAGLADLQGRFLRAELAAIVRYLPKVVDEDARAWMRHGLLAGRLVDAPVRLRGDLVNFPFGEQPATGDFEVGGAVHGVIIDYAPAAVVGKPGWPRLERLEGHAGLRRVDLTVTADSMRMRPGGQPIELRDVHARIPNIEQDSVLEVSGVGRANGSAFLALIRESPLGGLLDGLFDEARGEGAWEVPIQLTIPLLDTDASRVSGSIVFDGGGLHLAKIYPPVSELSGRVSFTEEAVAMHGLKGRVLGGPVSVTGGVGKGQKGIIFHGTLRGDAVDSHLDGRLHGLLDGATPYRLSLQRNAAGSYGMRLDATLEGLSLNLPAPVGKPAASRRPLRVQWTPASGKSPAALDVSFADGLSARLLRREGKKDGSFFYAGAVNLKGAARPPQSGLVMDIHAQRVDIDAWRALAVRLEGKGGQPADALFPPVRDFRLRAGRAQVLGTELDELTFTARQPEGQRWRVDVSSTQTAGTLFWQERQGRIQGDVEAHFQRLALGKPPDANGGAARKAPEADAASVKFDDEIDIPAIRLNVDRLQLYGREVGSLSVVGVNEARGSAWRLDRLELSSPHGVLRGSGLWRLQGAQRGLRIQANAMFDDLGAWLDQAGYKDLLQGGHGEVKGYVEWRGIPWRFERAALYGDLAVDLAKGRLISLGSRSARLLELLSLQSVRRLANFDWNPSGLTRQGFPFDTLQGNVRMESGVLHSENYRVAGPVGTIVIAGDVDLPRELLDLYAVVVPNLDVSGAAIAAGIAVNPIVGLGAFLTQWLLKDPLGKAMAVEYRVRGNFDEPQVSAVDTSAK